MKPTINQDVTFQSPNQSFMNTTSTLRVPKNTNKVYVPIIQTNDAKGKDMKETRVIDPPEIKQLRKVNSQLKQKQEIYIEKLMKLEAGLEKQHTEFMQLQDLYNGLFSSYKLKEEEVASLQMKFRQSDRKKSANVCNAQTQQLFQQVQEMKKVKESQKYIIKELEEQIQVRNNKITKLEKTQDKLYAEINYIKGKDKINDSKASLNSKVFEELEQWQKIADGQKQERIKLQYENMFLKNRNHDLEKNNTELEKIITQKQATIANLRKDNIQLHRENSSTRLSRSRSKSPLNYSRHSRKQDGNMTLVDRLTNQNRVLTSQIKNIQQQLNRSNKQLKIKYQHNFDSKTSSNSGNIHIREQQFFSFSKDELPGINTLQNNTRLLDQLSQQNKINQLTYENHRQSNDSKPQKNNEEFQDLQDLPEGLEVDELIKRKMEKTRNSFESREE